MLAYVRRVPEREGARDVSLAPGGVQRGLGWRGTGSAKQIDDRKVEIVRECSGLVEATAPPAQRMQGDGNHAGGICQEIAAGRAHQAGQRAGERLPVLVFERVDDRAERTVIEASRSTTCQGRGWLACRTDDSILLGTRGRQAALLTHRWCDSRDVPPATVTHDSAGWSVEDLLTGCAAGSPSETENAVAQTAKAQRQRHTTGSLGRSLLARFRSAWASGDVGEPVPFGVAPEALEVVEATCLLRKDMDDEVKAVDENPITKIVAFYMRGAMSVLPKPLDDLVDNRFHLTSRLSRTEREIVRERFRTSQVENDHVERLLLKSRLDGLADRLW